MQATGVAKHGVIDVSDGGHGKTNGGAVYFIGPVADTGQVRAARNLATDGKTP